MAVALRANRSSHSDVLIGWPVAGSVPNPAQYPSALIASFGIDPSTTRTNGSSSPRSALCHHSMNESAPCSGPHSKSISGQCTWIFGSPGRAPMTISSMLGWVAPVRATESPSHPSPPFIQRMWRGAASVSAVAWVSAVVVIDRPPFSRRIPLTERCVRVPEPEPTFLRVEAPTARWTFEHMAASTAAQVREPGENRVSPGFADSTTHHVTEPQKAAVASTR
jgi:hypothetical protein